MRGLRPNNFVPHHTAYAHAPSVRKSHPKPACDSVPARLSGSSLALMDVLMEAIDAVEIVPRTPVVSAPRLLRWTGSCFSAMRMCVPTEMACRGCGVTRQLNRHVNSDSARSPLQWATKQCRTGRGTCSSTRWRAWTVHRLVRSVSSSRFREYMGLGVGEQIVRLGGRAQPRTKLGPRFLLWGIRRGGTNEGQLLHARSV